MWDQLAPDEGRTRQQLSSPISAREAGAFTNFGAGAGNYFMRSMAEVGRAGSMAFSAVPVLLQRGIDAVDPGGRVNDNRLDDSYYRWHDETFQRAVDYWTPKPGEVGLAGQIVGQFGGGAVQFLANPALAVATAELSTAEDLTRQGVSPGVAVAAGGIAGAGTAIGIRAPAAIGSGLATQVASGAAINAGLGAAQAGATEALLKATDSPAHSIAQFDPWDVKARAVDALLGGVFGAKAHVDMRAERDAVSVAAQALHLELSALPGKPGTPGALDAGVSAVRTAMDQMARGEPVQVDALARSAVADPSPALERQRAEIADEVLRVAAETPGGEPIAAPRMPVAPPEPAEGVKVDAEFQPSQRTAAIVAERPDMLVPVVDAAGNVSAVKATDFLTAARREAKATASGGDLLRAAASCLLGAL